jgi:hypothetical protein
VATPAATISAEDLLARVIAPGSYICVAHKNPTKGRMVHRFFSYMGIAHAGGYLRWAAKQGNDAWYAVASFKEAVPNGTDKHGNIKYAGERTQANAEAFRAFWIDADVRRQGDKKGSNVYETREAADAWLDGFTASVGLPPPNLVVNSGYGYHRYWVLEDPMTRNEWQPYANALAATLSKHGFKCETGISSDAARILRPPGTLNFKAGAPGVPVTAVSDRGDYPNYLVLDKLKPFLGASGASTTVGKGSSPLASGGPAPIFANNPQQPNMNAAANSNVPHEPRFFGEIATKCPQVQKSLLTNGNGDPYQLWYLGFLSLAHHCEDGADFVHDIGKGDPRYSQPATEAAVAQIAKEKAKKDMGPPTCASFNLWRPGVCQGCPSYKSVVSPWVLGAGANGAATTVVRGSAAHPDPITSWPTTMAAAEALERMNKSFFIAHCWGAAPAYGHEQGDGVHQIKERQLLEMTANRRVRKTVIDADGNTTEKYVHLGKWWLEHPQRREYDQVLYDPEGKRAPASQRVFNLWTGFARSPRSGRWPKMAQHIFRVLCRGDREAFRYFMRWLAHLVQHPGSAPGTVVVLKSEAEGTGKTSLLEWLAHVFGEHGLMLSTPEDLIGHFNDHLEAKSLIGLNEPAFPGNKKDAGKLKSMITEPYWTLNGKYQTLRRVPNIAHILLTTNAEWTVPAGKHARRFLVLNVDESRAGDRQYFNRLWAEANNGGIEAMLHTLLRIDLSAFNPADVPRTAGLIEQQMLSANNKVQWALNQAFSGDLLPAPNGVAVSPNGGFGMQHAVGVLHDAYRTWVKAEGYGAVASKIDFGKWLKKCGFPQGAHHGAARTYAIPDRVTFIVAVKQQAGIR